MDEIIITHYNKNWPQQFKTEAELMKQKFKNHSFILEHIGSTSIPGLEAKPVIDMMLGFENHADSAVITQGLNELGYEHWKEDPHMHIRYFFVKWNDGRTARVAQIHVTKINGDFWKDQIKFRDKLRGDRALTKEYAELKRRLAEKFKNDRDKYIEAKTDFVNKVLNIVASEENQNRN